MIAILFSALFIGESLYLAHSAGTFTTDRGPELYGIASKSIFARRTKKVDGKLYIGGHSDGAIGTGGVGGFDFFIRKYPSDNPYTSTPLWTKMFGTAGTDYLGGFDVDASGNVFVVGMCSGTVSGVSTKGSGDACIFKLDSSGAVQCSAQYGGSGVDRFNGVALDEKNGYFYGIGNTTSASFDGTTTVGKAAGIFYRFQMSNCAQSGAKYVQSMPLATQTMYFGGVVVLSTGQAVVGFSISSPVAIGPTFTIAGHTPSTYAGGGTFGYIKVNTTTAGGSVPVKAKSVAGTGGSQGAYINDMAIDAYENMYLSCHIMTTGSSGLIYVKTDKSLDSISAGSRWGNNFIFVRGLGVEVHKEAGVVLFSGSVHHSTPGTSFTFEKVSYTAPVAFVLAFTAAGSNFVAQGSLVHTDGGATEDMAHIGENEYLALGASYGGFNGLTGTGVVNMFSYPFNFTLNPTSMPTAKPTWASPSTKPTPIPSSGESARPTETPSAVPSVVPSCVPSVKPSMVPSADPSAIPSLAPSKTPSALPSELPSELPSMVPSAVPTGPSPAPSAMPSIVPSSSPSEEPTAVPSVSPSALPSEVPSPNPSPVPSVIPSAIPSTIPSVMPSVVPSTSPSEEPTAVPSVNPSTLPSEVPSLIPSTAPSVIPSPAPSAVPSLNPSAIPSVTPSAVPSTIPSVMPSAAPSVYPSATPSAAPSAVPSTASPSIDPTAAPSAVPTLIPTAIPTFAPTNRPTDSTAVNLVLDVTQTVHNLDVATYNAQKAAFNVTFQQTIAATLDGITPQGITEIQVAQKTTADRIQPHAGTVPQCSLKYTLTMFDAQVEFSVFRAQLVQAVNEGTMDAYFRHFAGQHGIDNSSYFGEAQAALQGDGSSDKGLTGVMIAGIVIGVMLAIAFIGAAVGFYLKREEAGTVYHAPATSDEVTTV